MWFDKTVLSGHSVVFGRGDNDNYNEDGSHASGVGGVFFGGLYWGVDPGRHGPRG